MRLYGLDDWLKTINVSSGCTQNFSKWRLPIAGTGWQ
jgi:hypothetical protein